MMQQIHTITLSIFHTVIQTKSIQHSTTSKLHAFNYLQVSKIQKIYYLRKIFLKQFHQHIIAKLPQRMSG